MVCVREAHEHLEVELSPSWLLSKDESKGKRKKIPMAPMGEHRLGVVEVDVDEVVMMTTTMKNVGFVIGGGMQMMMEETKTIALVE